MHRATIDINVGGHRSTVISRSLEPELGKEVPRTSSRIEGTPDGMRLTIDAEDTVSLRAALNSYARWTMITLDTLEEVEGGE